MKAYSTKASREQEQAMRSVMPNGMYSQQRDYSRPLYFQREEGSRVWDLDGNEYLDLHMKFGAVLLGHHPPCLTRWLQEEIPRLVSDRSVLGSSVGERLKKMIPGFERMQFGLSGSEMVMHAVRLARCYTGRRMVLRFAENYHGMADGMWEKTNEQAAAHGVYILPWNDEDALDGYLERHAGEVAAILTEPVCVNGGGIEPEAGFLPGLRQRCDRIGAVLIFDEIVTGLRLDPDGGQRRYGVKPDLCLYGKCLTNGLAPLTVLMGSGELMRLYEEGSVVYAGTYNGYALGLQTALLTLEEYERAAGVLHPAMRARAREIHRCLDDACKRAGLPLVIQGPEVCASFHQSSRRIARGSELTDQVVRGNMTLRECMRRYGILSAPMSRLYPSFALCDADVEFFAERIRPAAEDAAALLGFGHGR